MPFRRLPDPSSLARSVSGRVLVTSVHRDIGRQSAAIRRAYRAGLIGEVVVVWSGEQDRAAALELCRVLSGEPRCTTASFEDAVQGLTLMDEVAMMPAGRSSLVAALAYAFGQSGTRVMLIGCSEVRCTATDIRSLRVVTRVARSA